MNEERYCPICHGKFVEKEGTKSHEMFKKEIVIHNVPYLHCDNCGEEEYLYEHKVNMLIRDTYRSGLSEADYV
ncbi:YgiT-type zinc finger protein [Priestia filamentosa]|uniref:YgiT-type zinc finger protein n=1 Tax=Priestia filamentosa TaxID=1402861 RepID=UPI0005892F07